MQKPTIETPSCCPDCKCRFSLKTEQLPVKSQEGGIICRGCESKRESKRRETLGRGRMRIDIRGRYALISGMTGLDSYVAERAPHGWAFQVGSETWRATQCSVFECVVEREKSDG